MKFLQLPGSGTYEEKKSRFIGEAFPITSEDEAEQKIAAVRKRYFDARHHCFAYVLGDENEIRRQSDDGEPSRTAGFPILEVLTKSEVRNALIIVTRYFGGTLLGTGGLVRAYTAAAKKALDSAGIAELTTGFRVSCDSLPYPIFNQILPALDRFSAEEDQTIYEDMVRASWLVPAENADAFLSFLTEAARGNASFKKEERNYLSKAAKS